MANLTDRKSRFHALDILTMLVAIVFGVVCCFGDYFSTFGEEGSVICGAFVTGVLFILSYGAKWLKTTNGNFKVCRIFEYVFLLFFVVALGLFGYIKFSPFVVVTEQKKENIQATMTDAINASLTMFGDYNKYVEGRKTDANNYMNGLVMNWRQDPYSYKEVFTNEDGIIEPKNEFLINKRKTNCIKKINTSLTISLAKDSSDLRSYKSIVTGWFTPMDVVDVAKDLPGRINTWNDTLVNKSNKKYMGEGTVYKFSNTVSNIPDLKSEFTQSGTSLLSWILIAVSGILMLLSYLFAKRNPKTTSLDWLGCYKEESYEEIL